MLILIGPSAGHRPALGPNNTGKYNSSLDLMGRGQINQITTKTFIHYLVSEAAEVGPKGALRAAYGPS